MTDKIIVSATTFWSFLLTKCTNNCCVLESFNTFSSNSNCIYSYLISQQYLKHRVLTSTMNMAETSANLKRKLKRNKATRIEKKNDDEMKQVTSS